MGNSRLQERSNSKPSPRWLMPRGGALVILGTHKVPQERKSAAVALSCPLFDQERF